VCDVDDGTGIDISCLVRATSNFGHLLITWCDERLPTVFEFFRCLEENRCERPNGWSRERRPD
jgi:hypothetical protein